MKEYLSEKKAIKRLKKSIIKKPKFISDKSNLSPIEKRIIKISRVALEYRGGQLLLGKRNHKFFSEVLRLTRDMKNIVERLVHFLKERELKGVAEIFLKTVHYSWSLFYISVELTLLMGC